MNTLLLILAIAMAAAFVLVFTLLPWRRGISGWRRAVLAVGCFMVVIGALCFFAPLISCLGGLDFLPWSFEWPIGFAEGVITTRDGLHVVPHAPSNRVQVYDGHWNFLRGWRVDAAGGSMALRETDAGIDVYTARGGRRYTYTTDGDLIGTEASEKFPGDSGFAYFVPTPWWALPLSHPVGGWGIAAAGLFAVVLLDEKRGSEAGPQSDLLKKLLVYVQRKTHEGREV